MRKVILILTIFLFTTMSINAAQNWDIQDGIKLVRAENYKEAVRFFEAYIGSFPNDADGHYYLGLSYKNLQDLKKSSQHLTKAYELAKLPSDIVIAPNVEELPDDDYLDMAQAFYESGDFEQAFLYIELAQKINPDNAYASYLKAHIYYSQKNIDGAKTHLYKALQEDNSYLDTELAKALNVTTIPPYNCEYYNKKGLQYYYGANLTQAQMYFEKAIALDNKNAKAYNNLAMTYAKLSMIDKAKANFKKAISLSRNYSAPYLNLAKLEPKQQEMYLKRAKRANPNDQLVYYALGNYYSGEKDYKNAIKNYQTAISINSKYFEPYFALAVCYSELEDYKNAMVYVKKASALNNKSAELSYYLAKLCLLNMRPNEALRYLQESIRKGENPVYYMEMGKIYYSRKDWPAAQNSFYKALELDMRLKNEAELYNYLGLCDYKSYDLEGAEYNLKMAVTLKPENMMYLYNLAQVHKSNEKKELYNEAIKVITSFSPKTSQDFLDLSAIYYDRNNTFIALKRINEGILRFPKERKLYEAKFNFYKNVGEVKAAQEVKDYIKANFVSVY